MEQVSYPRQKARTRGFQLGRPRSFTIAGNRVLFVRSSSGVDPVGSLWCIEFGIETPVERLLVDATQLLSSDELPAAERARRERMREVTAGITSFSVNAAGTTAVFAVSGIPFHLDLGTGATSEIAAPGPVVDPRINDAGTRVAFVHANSLWVAELGADQAQQLCASTHDDETWGLADYIAAEELSRFRGHWWLGECLLVEHVDSRPVAVHWISDPANPTTEPSPQRYPAAGTDNADIALWLIDADGGRSELVWDHDRFPYVATIDADGERAIVTLLSRDQRTARVMCVDKSGDFTQLAERTDPAWVDVMPGAPRLDDAGRLLEIVTDADTYRIARDGESLTPIGLQVRALLGTDGDALLYLASNDPTTQALYRTDADGTRALTATDGYSSAAVGDGVVVVAASAAEQAATEFAAHKGDLRVPIANLAEPPAVDVRPRYCRVGERDLACAVLLPTGHVEGSARLPVVLSPYGGPHGQRVVRSALSYATEQWIADQGFAVIVADGRGTPGRGPAWERAIVDDLARDVLQDQVDALLGVAERFPDLDTTRVGIRGWSFGGYLAALAVLDRPDVFAAAVAGAPVTDWALYDTAYTERYLGDPRTNPAAYERTSLLRRAAQLTRPLLLIHGLADDNVLVAHTLQLSSALLAAGRPHSVVPLTGVTHMTPQEGVAENLLRLEIDFFRANL